MDRDHEAFTGSTVRPEPVVAVTVTCNLGGERQMQLAAHFGRDASEEEKNRILDSVMKTADRQKARYDLEKLEENLTVVGLNTRNAIMALGAADSQYKTQVAKLKVELAAKEELRKEIHDTGYNEHAASGRKGAFKATGLVGQKLNRADMEIQATRDAIEAAPKDAEQERAKIVNSILRNQEDMRIRRKTINDLRVLAGLPANEEFLDAENAEV